MISFHRLRRDVEALAIPRTPGSPGSAQVAAYLSKELTDTGMKAIEIRFTKTIKEKTYNMSNIVGINPNNRRPRILLVAHRDSLPAYPGAIDAATCMAAMLEIVRLLPTNHTCMVAFVDGEEKLTDDKWTMANAMSGSQHLVGWLEAHDFVPDRLRVVVLDLWGGRTGLFSVPQDAPVESLIYYKRLEAIDYMLFPREARLFVSSERAMATQDDSAPFYAQGYRHVIDLLASPFPIQWHSIEMDTPKYVNYFGLYRSVLVLFILIMEWLT